MNYQVVKLSNGEDIICNVLETKDEQIKITAPLKMETYNRTTQKGVVESLGLSRWIQPYSDEENFDINMNTVIVMTPVSAGLQRYYEYVLKSIKEVKGEMKEPTIKEIKLIEKEEEKIEDLEEELNQIEAIFDKSKNTIH